MLYFYFLPVTRPAGNVDVCVVCNGWKPVSSGGIPNSSNFESNVRNASLYDFPTFATWYCKSLIKLLRAPMTSSNLDVTAFRTAGSNRAALTTSSNCCFLVS